jgi:hypothetical protein
LRRSREHIAEAFFGEALDALERVAELERALSDIHTGASVPDALDARLVREMAEKALRVVPTP